MATTQDDIDTPENAMLSLTTEDLSRVLDELDQQSTEQLKALTGIRVRDRFIRGGMVTLLRSKLRNRPPRARAQIVQLLARPVVDAAIALLGDDSPEPDLAQLTATVDPLVDRFGRGPVRMAFTFGVANGFTAAPHLRTLLETDDRLSIPEENRDKEADVGPINDDEDVSQSDVTDAAADLPEEERSLFSALDRLLIETAVASHNDQLGAPSRDELAQIIEEVVGLNAGRIPSNFHLGFLSGLDQEVARPSGSGSNEERRKWFAFGRLSGIARRGDLTALADEVLAEREIAVELVRDPEMGVSLTSPIVRSLLRSHPAVAAEFLDRRQVAFAGASDLLPDVYAAARKLLSANQPTDAAALFEALDGWSHSDTTHIDLRRRLASCRRAANDFVGATQILDDLAVSDFATDLMGLIETERGLIAAKIDHLGRVRFPSSANDVDQIIARLEPGEEWFRAGVEHNERDERANCCLGVLAWCQRSYDEAAILLERTEAAMRDDVYRSTGVLAAVRFHRALSVLLTLQPGTDGPSFKAINDALDEGYEPTDDELVDAVVALQAHHSPHTSRFVARALKLVKDRNRLRRSVTSLAREGDAEMLAIAARLVDDRGSGLTHEERFDVLEGMVEGACETRNRDLLDALPDKIEDLLFEAADPALDERYFSLLAESTHLREALGGVESELASIDLLARLGRVDEAIERGVRLFHRAAGDEIPGYSCEPILELLRALGASDEQLGPCERRLGASDREDLDLLAARPDPVRIAFVGGDERQAQYRGSIDAELADLFDGKVVVDWYFPGWGTNWSPTAERVESTYWQLNALVLMAFVRTNMGRRLRRTSGEHHVPWVACPGHGRGAVLAAIRQAVNVVAQFDERA